MSKAKATKPQRTPPQFIRPRTTCPAELNTLVPALLRDLPAYMNRQYARVVTRQVGSMSYAIAASQPDFTPLPAESSEYASPVDPNLHQVFFTVLERQYGERGMAEFQNYHWLFLSKTPEGWEIALMFSRFGRYPNDNEPLTRPRDSSQSLTAQAIRTWLRDCRAGAVKL
jgi:hypothetical protein